MRLTWAAPGSRFFETGVDRGVLYPISGSGVAWSGLIAVTESPTGGEFEPFYMDGIKYQNRTTNEEFGGTLEAYTYPSEFEACDGTLELDEGLYAAHQRRMPFGLSYRTKIGTDLDQDHGYKIHLIYNAMAAPTVRANTTQGESPEAIAFSWALSATPVKIQGTRPTSHLIVDSTETHPAILSALEDILYGSAAGLPRMPSPLELVALFAATTPNVQFVVTDLGDGIFEISGSDEAVMMVDATHFRLNSQYVIDHGDGSYTATTGIEDDPDGPTLVFTVEDLGSDVFKISGPDSMVSLTDENHFQLNTPLVTDNGDGSYTATSA